MFGKISSWRGLLLFILFFLFSSCDKEKYDDAKDRLYDKKAEALYLDGHRLESVKYLDSVYAGGDVSPLGEYLVYARKGQYYYEASDMAKSLFYIDSSIRVIEKNKLEHKYVKEYAHALLELGHVYAALNKFDSAYNSYLRGYAYVVTTGNKFAMHEFDYFIGMLLFKEQQKEEASKFFIKSFEEANECADAEKPYYRMQELLSNIAISNTGEVSRKYFDSCISFVQHNVYRFHNSDMVTEAIAHCYNAEGWIYYKEKMFDQAKNCYYKAIETYASTGNDNYAADVFDVKMSLAMIFFAEKDKIHFNELWNETRLQTGLIDGPIMQNKWYKMIYMHYDLDEDYKNAYHAYYRFNKYADSMIELTTNKGEAKDVVKEMENREQAYKIQLLTKDTQLQRIYLWTTIVVALLGALVILLVYSAYKRTQRNNTIVNNQKAALQKSNNEKNRILNIIAHDLRNPISAVAFIAEGAIDDITDPGTPYLPALQAIKNSSYNSLHLIDELASFARDEHEELMPVVTDITAIVDNAVGMMEQKAKMKNISIKAEFHRPLYGKVDINKIGRVIGNLLDNAIKFSNPGDVINISTEKAGDNILIVVRDSGIGIPIDLLPNLFDVFTPSGRRGTSGESSNGLGLSICKQIVEAHGGQISVESTEGKGAIFYIRLPA